MEKATQGIVSTIRNHLALPHKTLPTRRAVVPVQVDHSNACGYHTAWNWLSVADTVYRKGAVTDFKYSKCLCLHVFPMYL